MRKFQQGGVGVYNVPQGIVSPNIPNSPMINAPLIPVADMSPFLDAQMDQQRRKEIYDRELLRQQQSQLATDQKQYFTAYDSVFGETHNQAQRALLDQVKKDYKVSDEVVTAADNGVIMKEQLRNLQRAARDPRTLQVMGEVQVANKLLQRPMPQLVDTELAQYQGKLDEYYNWADPNKRFNIKELDPNYWNRPAERKINPASFYNTTLSTLKNMSGKVETEADLARFRSNWANNLALQNPEQALAQGYIQEDPNTGAYMIAPKGQAIADAQLAGFLQDQMYDREAKLEDREKAYQLQNQYRPQQPRQGSAEKAAQEKVEADAGVKKAWDILMSTDIKNTFGHLDPFDPKNLAVYNYLLKNWQSKGALTETDILDAKLWLAMNVPQILGNQTAKPQTTDGTPVFKTPPATQSKPVAKGTWGFVNGKYQQLN